MIGLDGWRGGEARGGEELVVRRGGHNLRLILGLGKSKLIICTEGGLLGGVVLTLAWSLLEARMA